MGGALSESTSAVSVDREDASIAVPTTDDLFSVLANRRRRYVLHYLKRTDLTESIEIGTLAEQIAAWENDVSLSRVSSTQRKRVYTALQQSHLPKMDAAGVLAFEKDRGLIQGDPVIEEFDISIDLVASSDIPWSEYYLALSSVCAALLAAVWIGAYPFSQISAFGWALVIVVVFSLSSIAHLYTTRTRTIGTGERPPEIDHR